MTNALPTQFAPSTGRLARTLLGAAALAGAAAMTGCQADYAADIHNRTSQPVFVQMTTHGHGLRNTSAVAATKRLGPGDRGYIGPVRARERAGSVSVTVDTLPNPSRPVTLDLFPGTSFVEVTQQGDATSGPIRVHLKQ